MDASFPRDLSLSLLFIQDLGLSKLMLPWWQCSRFFFSFIMNEQLIFFYITNFVFNHYLKTASSEKMQCCEDTQELKVFITVSQNTHTHRTHCKSPYQGCRLNLQQLAWTWSHTSVQPGGTTEPCRYPWITQEKDPHDTTCHTFSWNISLLRDELLHWGAICLRWQASVNSLWFGLLFCLVF